MPGLRRQAGAEAGGSTLVQTMVIVMVALLGGLFLSSRMMASRSGAFTRSDSLAAREAAEYGLNELQAVLNTNLYSYLWITKQSNWSGSNAVTLNDLNTCKVPAIDNAGQLLTALPSLPASITESTSTTVDGREISNNSSGRLSYQLISYTVPRLPSNNPTTTQLGQEDVCGTNNLASANKFGNLNGGSAVILVRGKVSRNGRESTFTLSRSVHVAPPSQLLSYSFIILGDAYDTKGSSIPISPTTWGNSSDITKLGPLDGNICYGTYGASPACSLNAQAAINVATIGCFDLDACLVNNVDTVSTKQRDAFCAVNNSANNKWKAKAKRRAGILCNSFQQVGDLPVAPNPSSVGFSLVNNSTSWNTYARKLDCKTSNTANRNTCVDPRGTGSGCTLEVSFPYITGPNGTTAGCNFSVSSSALNNLANVRSLRNRNLVSGCYFNNTDGTQNALATTSTAINCFFNANSTKSNTSNFKLDCDNNNACVDLIVYTQARTGNPPNQLLPVNIFIGPASTSNTPGFISLSGAGIRNIDTTVDSWQTLRIIGYNSSNRLANLGGVSTGSLLCDHQNLSLTAAGTLSGAHLWLPNGTLDLSGVPSGGSTFTVIWACKVQSASSATNAYRVITPPADRMTPYILANALPGFASSSISTFRAFGSVDTAI